MDVAQLYEFPVKEFFPQPRALIGPGAHEMAGEEAAGLGLKHVLFVTSGLSGTGIIDEMRRIFKDAGVAVSVYDKVESNPKDYNCMDSYSMFTEEQCDGFVSIGGGSAHDTTKGARLVAAHDGRNINEFEGLAPESITKRENPPHIAINTTVGTGSETTPAAVITDLSSDRAPHKWVVFDRSAVSTLAINDPLFMMTQPKELVAFTGFDTLAHGAESYMSRVEHPASMPESLKAVQITAETLREAAANPSNFRAMAKMCWAQYMAAQAFSSGFLGAMHSMSHAVCAYYDIHHGLNNAIGLARVWQYNQPAVGSKLADIAQAMGVDTTHMSVPQAGDAAMEALVRLTRDLGIPDNFSGVDPHYAKSRMGQGWYSKRPTAIRSDDDELAAMGQHMLDDVCTPGNPRDMRLEDCIELLRDSTYDPMERSSNAPARIAPQGRAVFRAGEAVTSTEALIAGPA